MKIIETISFILSIIALILSVLVIYKKDNFAIDIQTGEKHKNFLDSRGKIFKLSDKCTKLLDECNDNYSGPKCYSDAWKKCQPSASIGEPICSNSNYSMPGWLECPNFVKFKMCDTKKYGCELGEGQISGCPDCDHNKLCKCDKYGKHPFFLHKE